MRKYWGVLLVAIIIGFGILPGTASAIEANDPKFEAFLEDIQWEKQDYIDYLESNGWFMEDFWYIDELGTPLTEEAVKPVLQEFELSREELNELLVEYGDIEEGQDVLDGELIIFAEELQEYVDIYINGWTGTPIDDENLGELLEFYELDSVEALEDLLGDYDESIEDYEFIEDLESSVGYYTYEDTEAYNDGELTEYMNPLTGSPLLDSVIILAPAVLHILLF